MQPPEVRASIPPPDPSTPIAPEDTSDGLTITWKDGLPDDPLERAQIEQIVITSGLTSKFSAIKRLLDGDVDAAQDEMERMAEEGAEQAQADADALMMQQLPVDEEQQSGPPADDKNMAKAKAERGIGGSANDKQSPKKQPTGNRTKR